jgi:regulator of replication initiation timing
MKPTHECTDLQQREIEALKQRIAELVEKQRTLLSAVNRKLRDAQQGEGTWTREDYAWLVTEVMKLTVPAESTRKDALKPRAYHIEESSVEEALKQRIGELEKQLTEAHEASEEVDKRWQEIIQEELALTLELFEAIGADYTKVQEEGQPIMQVMLAAIAALKAKAKLWEKVKAIFEKIDQRSVLNGSPYSTWDAQLHAEEDDTIEEAVMRLP